MKHKKTMTSAIFLLLGLGGLYAQESPIASGGEAIGTGGICSYSVGQIIYSTNTGTSGTISQGVQQPYEISTTVGINETSISLELSVYPNPVSNFLQLNVESEKLKNLTYQLYNLQGKLLQNSILAESNTTVKMENLPRATYLLKITNNNQIIKIFKIIKN